MAKKVSLVNMKGGVGKSTLTVNFAWQFAGTPGWNKRVLVVDLDPQFNSSQYLLGAQAYQGFLDQDKPTVWDILEKFTRTPGSQRQAFQPHEAIHEVKRWDEGGRLDLVPSRLELAYSLKAPAEKERLVTWFIQQVEDQYDLVLLDCPPTESLLTTAAYLASDFVLVPVRAEFLSSIGLPLLVQSIQEFAERNNGSAPEMAGIVFNATSGYFPEEKRSRDEVIQLAGRNGWYVFENEVPYSRSFPKGAREGKPIFDTSYARRQSIAKFAGASREFAQKIGL